VQHRPPAARNIYIHQLKKWLHPLQNNRSRSLRLIPPLYNRPCRDQQAAEIPVLLKGTASHAVKARFA
jgi:hypothetical protein